MRAALRTAALVALAMAMVLDVAAATDLSVGAPRSRTGTGHAHPSAAGLACHSDESGMVERPRLPGSATSSPSSSTTKTNNGNGLPNPLVLAIQTLPFFRPVDVAGDDKGKVDPFDGDKGKGKQLAAAAGAAPRLPTPPAAPSWQQLAAAAGAAPGMLTPPSEQQGATAELAAMRTAALVALAMAMVLNVAAATDLSGSATSTPSSSTTKTNNDNGLPNPLVLAIQTLPFFRPVNVAGDDKGKVEPFDGDKGKGKVSGPAATLDPGTSSSSRWQVVTTAAFTWTPSPRPLATTVSPLTFTTTIPTPSIAHPSLTSATLPCPSTLPSLPPTTAPLPPISSPIPLPTTLPPPPPPSPCPPPLPPTSQEESSTEEVEGTDSK
ncbi:hypothetical protein V8C86DRAFT_3097523 [Haematococcus lacustris]